VLKNWINLSALWRIVVIGVLAGAGLPALFAVGLRALSTDPRGGTLTDDDDRVVGGSSAGIAVAAVCFVVVLAAIGYGVYLIVKAS
jgi:hypothetical protein